nr:alcohol dehydrogenase-like 1 isoform X1 [Ipomoea trifida]
MSRCATFVDGFNACGLLDMGTMGVRYSWFRQEGGRTVLRKRLDRVFWNLDAQTTFPEAKAAILPRAWLRRDDYKLKFGFRWNDRRGGIRSMASLMSSMRAPKSATLKRWQSLAAVCRGAGEAVVIEEIEVAPPKPWEVRIKIICSSLCHSDLTFWKFKSGPMSLFPRILGHEAAGMVESVGENVDEVATGDMVIPVFRRNCGECRDCRFGKGNVCTKFAVRYPGGMPRDGTSRFKDKDGQSIHHLLNVSSFSQYTVVDITHVVKMNPDFPIDMACLLSCGVTTGIGAAWKVAKIEEGSTVAIFGLGVVGLAVIQIFW